MVERSLCMREVEGSMPSISTQIDKRCGAEEACWAHNPEVIGSKPIAATNARVAQWIRRGTSNPKIAGSSPAVGSQ